MIKQGLHTLGKTFATHGTFWLMLDVGRGPRAAPRSGHDVAGPDINLDFPYAQFCCTARLGSSDVAQDRRPTEKQAPAGKFKLACLGYGALGTHKAGRLASESWCWPAAGILARLAMIATAISKSVETDHVIAYVTNLEKYGLHALRA